MRATVDDIRKYSRPHLPTFFDVCIKRTYLPIKLGCPFELGNVIRCLDYQLNCLRCLRMYAYCRNITGIGRV